MPEPRLEEVFKTGGIPTYTFVEPKEYADLVLNLRTPGRGLVVEGPSGIGKTTAIETALKQLGIATKVIKLSARLKKDIDFIEHLPEFRDAGIIIVDDFHKLDPAVQSVLADYMKTLADQEATDTKIIAIGINKAGQNLITFANDLVNRIDIITFESNPDFKVRDLIEKGSAALKIRINIEDEIVSAAQGSFYIAQMLCREVCKRGGILEATSNHIVTNESFSSVNSDVWERLSLSFRPRCERFCRGTKMKREGRAPYLHILRWLAEGASWSLSLRESMRFHPEMRGSVGQVVDKNYLRDLIAGDHEISAVLHYDEKAEQLTVEDPQFIFFIRNIPWKRFALEIGFMSVEFENRYDFALSFAGEDRDLAERIFSITQDNEVEVFYDKNEQHRILAADVEEYLKPIYQSDAKYVIVLLGPSYPKKVWTKFESEQFRDRFGKESIIPVWFTTAMPGIFDESRKYGGYTYDPGKPLEPQAQEITQLALKKLAENR